LSLPPVYGIRRGKERQKPGGAFYLIEFPSLPPFEYLNISTPNPTARLSHKSLLYLRRFMIEIKTPTFYIRNIPICGNTILAPMDGYSDWPFRSICRALGSAMSYTEFVKVEKILSHSKEPAKRLYYEEVERPITFQIYGDDPDLILEAALKIQPLNPDIIDLNMGCPAKSIADRGAGVGMMPSPLKIAETFKKLTSALKVPVTGKIRLGWDRDKNYKLIARIVEENGGSLIAVHGRTKEQR
jgi:tRNA-dihydrouridine synthase